MDPKLSISSHKFLEIINVFFGSYGHHGGTGDPADGWAGGPIGPNIRLAQYTQTWVLPTQSDPAYFAAYTRCVVNNLLSQYQIATAMAGSEQDANATKVIAGRVAAMAEGICGNELRRFPIPLHPGPSTGGGGDEPRPISPFEMLATAAQFDYFARALDKHALQSSLIKAADLIAATAVEKLNVQR